MQSPEQWNSYDSKAATVAIKVHEFYQKYSLRTLEIPVGEKAPIHVKRWQDSTKPIAEVQEALDSQPDRYNKYGWLLDEDHVVIDIDVHDPKENGWDALARLESKLGFTLESKCGAIVRTPSGGAHFYFSKEPSVKFGKVFKQHYAGIDFISGRGKQVVAANSLHDKCSGFYAMQGGKLFPLPQEVIDHLLSLRDVDAGFRLRFQFKNDRETNSISPSVDCSCLLLSFNRAATPSSQARVL